MCSLFLTLNNIEAQQKQVSKTRVETKKEVKSEAKSYKLNDISRFIAGMPLDTESELYPVTKTPEWIKYQKESDSAWIKFQRVSDKIKAWKNSEIPASTNKINTLFYPFGGPDYLFADIFFPNANNYILIGLENPGNVPKISTSKPAELKQELNLYKKAIEDVIQLSFFRTNDMKNELKSKTIDGAAPIIMLFLARSGKEVVNVTPMNLNELGKMVPSAKGGNAIDIAFKNPNDTFVRHVYYLSTNLADPSLGKNKPFMKYLGNIDSASYSFVKSATYLMHKNYFSIIRNTVLNKSVLILQDDSGIAYKYFKKDSWDISLYGVYEKPIELFNEFYEPDLLDAYKKSSKPINFRYGYNRKSNLLLAVKKK
jgi:hypothetical protein